MILAYIGWMLPLEAPRHLVNAKAEAKNAFLCSILAAVCLNIVQCVAVEQLGPLMQSIVGTWPE